MINGTFREEEYCPICGEKGHRQFECTNRTQSFKPAGVKCSICGDLSHPTRDCPLKEADIEKPEFSLDQEYSSFMAELDGKKRDSTVFVNVKLPDNVSVGTSQVQPTSGVSSSSPVISTPAQTTIVVPAYVDGPMYSNPTVPAWTGGSYVPPPMASTYQPYPSFQPPVLHPQPQMAGTYYPPPQDFYKSYPQNGNSWPNPPASGPRPPVAPPLPSMPKSMPPPSQFRQ